MLKVTLHSGLYDKNEDRTIFTSHVQITSTTIYLDNVDGGDKTIAVVGNFGQRFICEGVEYAFVTIDQMDTTIKPKGGCMNANMIRSLLDGLDRDNPIVKASKNSDYQIVVVPPPPVVPVFRATWRGWEATGETRQKAVENLIDKLVMAAGE